MSAEQHAAFYKSLGRALTVARERRRLSIAQLSSVSGQHHKTIRGIEAGNPTSMHHLLWMKRELGIDVNDVIARSMEGMSGKEKRSGLDELV